MTIIEFFFSHFDRHSFTVATEPFFEILAVFKVTLNMFHTTVFMSKKCFVKGPDPFEELNFGLENRSYALDFRRCKAENFIGINFHFWVTVFKKFKFYFS